MEGNAGRGRGGYGPGRGDRGRGGPRGRGDSYGRAGFHGPGGPPRYDGQPFQLHQGHNNAIVPTPNMEIESQQPSFTFRGDPQSLDTLNRAARAIMPQGTQMTVEWFLPAQLGSKRVLDSDNERNVNDQAEPREKKAKKSQKGWTLPPEVIDPNVCGNCGGANHKAAYCVTIDRFGWMPACPKCDIKRHTYEVCPQRQKSEDFTYLILNRRNKPPVKCNMSLGKLINREVETGTTWHKSQSIHLPYTSRFARQEARVNPPENYTYQHVGNPEQEAKARVTEPDRAQISLEFAATVTMKDMWTPREEDEQAVADDGPMPTQPTMRDIRGYTRCGQPPAPVENPFADAPLVNNPFAPAPIVTDSTPIISNSRSRSRAALQRAAPPRIMLCSNCGSEDHIDCNAPCAACGGTHSVEDCPDKLSSCTCTKWPRHTHDNCSGKYCRVYPHAELVIECTAICHRCLGQHPTVQCEEEIEDTSCQECKAKGDGEQYHLATECVWNWCPVKECEHRLSCEEHCTTCGWTHDEQARILKYDHKHKCQFRKVWTNESDPSVLLQCLKNEAHQFRNSELLELREVVVSYLENALDQGLYMERAPTECPGCRKMEH
ncbi:hypothetical protein F5Y08DRAFT_351095 [Xylaria arbuscula]|nr:hypothetical protein F5Y08DRAFT_351095 [Xylaria arbuscula]